MLPMTSFSIQSTQIFGSIPSSFSAWKDSLERFNIANTFLDLEFPRYFAEFPRLQELFLSNTRIRFGFDTFQKLFQSPNFPHVVFEMNDVPINAQFPDRINSTLSILADLKLKNCGLTDTLPISND